MLARPDPNTFEIAADRRRRRRAGRPDVLRHLAPSRASRSRAIPRYVLKRNLERAREKGFTFFVGPEMEFFYFRVRRRTPSPLDNAGLLRPHRARHRLTSCASRRSCSSRRWASRSSTRSTRTARASTRSTCATPTRSTMADNVMTFRLDREGGRGRPRRVRDVHAEADRRRVRLGDAHARVAVRGRRQRVPRPRRRVRDVEGRASTSSPGLLVHASEITAITNQWVNSYKRLIPGYEAPVYKCWARNNRSALVRVPLSKTGKNESSRIEFRAPDPACNPYLAFSLILAAGLKGIDEGYELPPEATDNIYALTDEERRRRGHRLAARLACATRSTRWNIPSSWPRRSATTCSRTSWSTSGGSGPTTRPTSRRSRSRATSGRCRRRRDDGLRWEPLNELLLVFPDPAPPLLAQTLDLSGVRWKSVGERRDRDAVRAGRRLDRRGRVRRRRSRRRVHAVPHVAQGRLARRVDPVADHRRAARTTSSTAKTSSTTSASRPFHPKELEARLRHLMFRAGRGRFARGRVVRRPRVELRDVPGRGQRQAARPHVHGVRAAEVLRDAPGQGVHARAAALAGVGLRVLRRRAHGRRARPASAGEARRGEREPDPDGAFGRLPLRPVPLARQRRSRATASSTPRSWVESAARASAPSESSQPVSADHAPPTTNSPIGPTMKITSRTSTTPITPETYRPPLTAGRITRRRYCSRQVGPDFDLDLGAGGERGDLDGRAGGAVIAERLGVHRVHGRELRDVGDEHGRLGDVGERARRSRRSTAVMLASTWRACASTPPATIAPVAGSSPTWPGQHQPVAGAHRGRIRARRRRCTRCGNAVDRHGHLLGAGNVTGRPSAFHVAAATAANTASVDRARAGRGIVDDRHARSAASRTARSTPNDRIVRSWISPVVGVDREPFARDPAERHVRGADRVGTQHDLVERVARRDASRRRASTLPALDRDLRASRARRSASTTSTSRVERARDEHRLLREADARAGPRSPAGRARRPRSSARAPRCPAAPATTRGAPGAARDDAVDLDDAAAARPRPPRSAGASDRGARRPRASRRRAPRARSGRRARARPAARPSAPCRRTRRRSRAATRARRRARTTTRRVRGTRARPTASRVARRPAGTRACGRAAARARRRSCAGPAPSRRAPAPRAATRRRPTAARRPRPRRRRSPAGAAPRPARRAARCRRRTARRRAARRGRRAAAPPPSSAARRPRPRRGRARPALARRSAPPRSRRGPSASPCTGTGARRARGRRRASALARERASRSPACRTRTAIHRSRRTRPRSACARTVVETFDRRDRAALDARDRGHARDPRLAVDEHRATAALTLRRAPVLGRHDAEALAQHVQQRLAPLEVGVDDDRRAVEHERRSASASRRPYSPPRPGPDAKRPRRSGAVRQIRSERQENDWPQPQVRCAFGLLIAKPAPWRPSL